MKVSRMCTDLVGGAQVYIYNLVASALSHHS